MAPKPLLEQWQEELLQKLAIPSARWEGGGWVTERDEFHPALAGKGDQLPAQDRHRLDLSGHQCAPRPSATVRWSINCWKSVFPASSGTRRTRFDAAICRRTTSIRRPEKKLLYQFAEQLAARAKTLLLATATPVQLHSMELWDLLYILSMNNPQVLGSPNSLWRKVDGPEIFDIVAGRKEVEALYDKWRYWRDPLPSPLDAKAEVFDWVRHDLGLAS